MDQNFFQNPTTNPDNSVSGFWFWNDLITDEKTDEQLNIMRRIHANQPVVHARFGLQNQYLSTDWFERIQHSIDTCRRNGQKIWLYDENNWPSGNCNWTITKDEKYREHFLQFERTNLYPGDSFYLSLSKDYVAVMAYQLDGGMQNLLDNAADGVVCYTALSETEVIAAYVAVDSYEPVGKLCVDYLSKDAIRVFIESTHEKYREWFGDEFGGIISGIFMDETRFCNAMPWTKTLPEEFRARKGYDIYQYIPLLIKNNKLSNLFRFDYYDIISDMYVEATFKQIYDWCENNKLKTIGHFLGEETIATQSYFGADMLRGYKYFHVPGIDHLGNGIGSLDAKFASSACHHYGKNRIACEAFGACGWDITFEDMVRISNWLFQQGINLIIVHGFYYSIRDERFDDFPPSYFYQWKYWDKMPDYILMANRMMEMLSDGQHESDILVYSPIETFWNHFEPDLSIKTGFWAEGPWITNEQAARIDNKFQLICNSLTDYNLDYDILGSDAASNFIVEGSKVVNTLSGECYSIIILPMVEILSCEMVNLINAFTASGGTVVSYLSNIIQVVSKDGAHMRGSVLPVLDASAVVNATKLSDIVELCREEVKLPFEILSGVNMLSHSVSTYPAHLIDPYIHDGERLYGVGVTRYIKKGKRILNFTNYNTKDEELTVSVESKDIPEIYIPENGEILLASAAIIRKGIFLFNITLPANRTIFVVCSL